VPCRNSFLMPHYSALCTFQRRCTFEIDSSTRLSTLHGDNPNFARSRGLVVNNFRDVDDLASPLGSESLPHSSRLSLSCTYFLLLRIFINLLRPEARLASVSGVASFDAPLRWILPACLRVTVICPCSTDPDPIDTDSQDVYAITLCSTNCIIIYKHISFILTSINIAGEQTH